MKVAKVVHCMVSKYDVYIGRGKGGKFGNPFTHKDGTQAKFKVATREEAVEKYREYALNNEEIMKSLGELKGKILGCWCAGKDGLTTSDVPFRCHGQVLLELIEEKKKGKYKVFNFYIPHKFDFNEIVEMLMFNGIKVDDLCDTCRDGRLVNLWVNEDNLDDYTLDQKVGRFLGEK
jgi:hypothetical protein